MRLRFIGDCHGWYGAFIPLLEGADHYMQVGDLGLNYEYLKRVVPQETLDKLKVVAGNHDCYDRDSPNYFKKHSFFLRDYGVHEIPGGPSIFYVRGAWSIDQEFRKRDRPPTWWEEEELSYAELDAAITLYKEVKPELVVTHEAPFELVKHVTDPAFARSYGFEGEIKTRTNQALQAMFDFRQPGRWICGHFHCRKDIVVGRTTFSVLDMLRDPVGNKTAILDLEF